MKVPPTLGQESGLCRVRVLLTLITHEMAQSTVIRARLFPPRTTLTTHDPVDCRGGFVKVPTTSAIIINFPGTRYSSSSFEI